MVVRLSGGKGAGGGWFAQGVNSLKGVLLVNRVRKCVAVRCEQVVIVVGGQGRREPAKARGRSSLGARTEAKLLRASSREGLQQLIVEGYRYGAAPVEGRVAGSQQL